MSDSLYAIVCKCLFARWEIEMICPCFRRSESFPALPNSVLAQGKGGKFTLRFEASPSLRPLNIVQTPPIVNVHSSLTRRRACYESEASLPALIWLFREPRISSAPPLVGPWPSRRPFSGLSASGEELASAALSSSPSTRLVLPAESWCSICETPSPFSSLPIMAAKLRKLNIGSMPAPPPGGVFVPPKAAGDPDSTKEDVEDDTFDIWRKWDLLTGSGAREGKCNGNDS